MSDPQFLISVVIPVFNAEKYLKRAVDSAINQKEVKEVILIEDGSPDYSLILCQELEKKYEKVKLFTHIDNANLGPGNSRNFGVEKATCPYIAFLDADDYYLPNRFVQTAETFTAHNIDGVYEVIGVTYSSENKKEEHLERMENAKRNIVNKRIPIDHTGIEERIKPSDLFYHLLRSDFGWIHLNGITIKTDALQNFELFNLNYLGQDTEFLIRLSAERKLIGTHSYAPVAVRNVHEENRILKKGAVKKNKSSVDNTYWIKYCLEKGLKGKELKYLILRVSDSGSKIRKAVKLLVNSFKILLVIFNLKKVNSLRF